MEPVEVAPLGQDDGLPLQAVMDEVSSLIQVGRRAAFDMTPFGPTAARAVGLVRAGAPDEARRMLTNLRVRLYEYLSPRFAGRVEQLQMKLDRMRLFLRVDQAQTYLANTRAALKAGDFAKAQLELRRLEGETTRLDEELGTLGETLEQVDLLTQEVERMGGDSTPALLFQGKALEAARAGDRRKAEGLLTTSSAMLLDILAPLMGQELVRLTETLKRQRAKGRDIRAAVGLVRQITVDLKSRNYTRALAALERLREEVPRDDTEEEAARPSSLAGTSRPVTRIKGRGTATSVSSTAGMGGYASSEGSSARRDAPERGEMRGEEGGPAGTARSEPPPEIRAGRSYLVLESRARKAAAVFVQLKGRKPGLFLTTTFPPRILDETPLGDAEVVWLSDSKGWQDALDPRAIEHEVASRVHTFLKKEGSGAVGVDGIAYLISENGVDKVEKFLKSLLDTAAARGVGVVVTLAPGGIEPKAQARLGALFDASM